MYTLVHRRTINRESVQETMEHARTEFFPKLQQAQGFVGFYLVTDEANGINTAIVVWESKAHADSFEPSAADWLKALDEFGHVLQSDNRGETVVQLEAQR